MTNTEIMFGLVEEWKSSGQTQKVFCQQHDLKLSTFGYWIAKNKRSEQPSGGFMPIEVDNKPGQQVEITYPNGVRISVGSGDLRLISQLIHLH
ncbi:MAG: hypothetical protein U5K69_22630 [Balneolaceae bacterium]|nr:hypothetical protein [Balneolaceae bacterium]